MKLKQIRLKFLEVLGLNVLLKSSIDNGVDEKAANKNVVKKASWMMPISHGYYVVEGRSWGEDYSNEFDQPDHVVVQREEIGNLESWFYSISDAKIGESIAKYMQSNFFDKNLFKESEIREKSKETMKKAYLNARAKLKEDGKLENVGSSSAMVINAEKLVVCQMGDHKAVVCRDGIAHQLRSRNQHRGKRHWLRRLVSGAMRIPKVRMQACHTGSESGRKQNKSSEVIVGTENRDLETEFIILASSGVWEVMKKQEAVDLIRHIEDPQEAAECLAKEAVTRRSRSNISCLVIRFD